MSPLSQNVSDAVLAACKTNASESGSSLGRTFGGDYRLTPLEPVPLASALAEQSYALPGLALVLPVGDLTAVVLLRNDPGLLPPWVSAPDKTGTSKLTTLAQELGMCLLPEDCMPDDFRAVYVADLEKSLQEAAPSENAVCLPHKLTLGDITSTLLLVWPLSAGKNIVAKPIEAPALADVAPAISQPAAPVPSMADVAPPVAPAQTPTSAVIKGHKPKKFTSVEEGLPALPPYTRSLLKIKVPVRVVLAEATLPVHRIVELAQGAIIPFNKSCEDMLTLDVSDCRVAVGEAVKVGDKFGIRISAIAMPEEKFWTVRGKRESKAG